MIPNRRLRIMTKWQRVKLGNIADVIGGGTPSTKNYDFWNGDISWLTPKDLSGYKERYISKGERNITNSGLQNSSARLLPKGTVLLTSRAPIGYLAIAKQEVCTNQGFKSIVLKSGYSPEFFYYLLKNNMEYIIGMSSGSTFAEISGTQVKNLEFNVPDYDTQKKIARVLGALDDKIELNNKINQNLESQAQALFFNFIQKKPFEQKMLSDVSVIKYGKGLPTNKLLKTGYKVFGGNGIIGYYSEFLYKEPQILISCRGAASGTILESHPFSYITNNSLIVELNDRRYYEFLKRYFFLNQLHSYATGSAQPQITIDNIKTVEIPYPNFEEIEQLSLLLKILSTAVYQNIGENTRLAQLRDILLPKLMSGEIDVSNVDISALTSADKSSFSEV